jgi:2-hydroxy-3-keto-5-methylthiopentenyl-1-phosphate phosphatase
MRSLSKKLLSKGSRKEKLMSARDLFLKHLNLVKSSLKEGVDILKKVESVRGKIKFDLPPFASDIDFEVCMLRFLSP